MYRFKEKTKIAEMLFAVMRHISDRYESCSNYPWLDTKFDIFTGENFADTDPIRGKNTVYSWIQGRGLEAVVGHVDFIESIEAAFEEEGLSGRLRALADDLLNSLIKAREKNNGHLFFTLNSDSQAIAFDSSSGSYKAENLTETSACNFSDLFCSKGMYAAARYLGFDKLIPQCVDYCYSVYDSIINASFITDQQQLDPKNPVRPVEGRISHGPAMICIGMFCLLAKYEQDDKCLQSGLRLIEHILNSYTNIDMKWPDLNRYDFVEFIDSQGNPYKQENSVLNDPGHTLEFVGLSLKFTDLVRKIPHLESDTISRLDYIESQLPHIYARGFENGFRGKGFCKLYDLTNNKSVNSDMPWWSLPETIRAAAYCYKVTKEHRFVDDITKCSEAFFANYVLPERNFFQYQTIDIEGKPIKAIPATPDLDPGYHTGLSLIDAMAILDEVGTPV